MLLLVEVKVTGRSGEVLVIIEPEVIDIPVLAVYIAPVEGVKVNTFDPMVNTLFV